MVEVPALDTMDTETLYKHLNKRHMPIGGLTSMRPFTWENGATRALRAYHEHVHSHEPGQFRHTHLEAQ